MELSVNEIAELVNGTVVGDGAVRITGVAGIEEAGPGDLTFVRDDRYARYLDTTQAAAVLIKAAPPDCPIPAIEAPAPDMALAGLLQRLEAQQRRPPAGGVHPSAVVAPTAAIGPNVSIDAYVVIGENATVGANSVLYAGVYIGADCTLGEDCIVYPNAVLREATALGDRCLIHAGAVLGSDGFGFTEVDGRWVKIPQVGRVVLEDDVEVGANTAIDRATMGETRIGRGVKIDNLAQVGHNVRIGNDSALAGMVGVSGSAKIGNNVKVGATAGVAGHREIGDRLTVGARAGVTHSIEPGRIVSGFPAIDHAKQRRAMVAMPRVPELLRRVRNLERQLEALTANTRPAESMHEDKPTNAG